MSNLVKKEKGFTLIEIVLVLAIAGLIMVIVFLALSGAQKNRRDTQRKQDNARLLSQLESYASNNNGLYPQTAAEQTTFTGSYEPNNFTDPLSGGGYTVNWAATACTAGNYGTVSIVVTNAGHVASTTMCLEQGSQTLTTQ